jgi:hypothetical protein
MEGLRMNKEKKNKKIVIVALALILFISIGYAVITSKLSINTIANIGKIKFDVEFENVQIADGSVEATVAPAITNNTTVNYEVNLDNPGDYYEFTVDVVNKGTVDAKIDTDGIVKTQLSDTESVFASYVVTYADGSTVSEGDTLAVSETKTLLVRVEYNEDITVEQLNQLTNDIKLDLTYSLDYVLQ